MKMRKGEEVYSKKKYSKDEVQKWKKSYIGKWQEREMEGKKEEDRMEK